MIIIKRILVFIIIVLLSISQLGCNKKQENNIPIDNKTLPAEWNNNIENPVDSLGEIPYVQGKKLVRKANKTKYLLSNGIAILRKAETVSTSNGKLSISIPIISGLVNKALEDKINKSIESDLENEVKIYAEEREQGPINLFANIELNANNLLSISLQEDYSPPLYGFLYRLTDGKKLLLKDIFTEGTDYLSLIDQKVVEGILKKGEEENFLSKPFSTIKPDQNFVLTEAALNIVFHQGEEGFLARNSVSIPLSEVDDYVDVTDRYSGTERKTQVRQSLIIRKNNIFITNKSEIIKKTNGDVWSNYPQISGIRDAEFEEVINNTIKDGINEVMNNKALDSMTKRPDQIMDNIALVQMVVSFNHYGILCVERVVNGNLESNELEKFNKVYTFDLIKKKRIDAKDLFISYIGKSEELQQNFANFVRVNLTTEFRTKVINNGEQINYNYIMDKGEIYFINGETKDEIIIIIQFKENNINGISGTTYCRVPLKNIIKGEPEDFFGW